MREITIKIHKIDELSEKAQKYAHQQYIEEGVYTWDAENKRSLNEFMIHMPVDNWHINSYDHLIFDPTNALIWDMKGIELQTELKKHDFIGTWKEGGCDLTGYCADCSLTDIFWHFMQLPEPAMQDNDMRLDQLILLAYDEWGEMVEKDKEDHESLEHFLEDSRANDLEYYSNGELY